MMEIFSMLTGGLLRIAPEIMDYLDRKDKRKHELALGKQQKEITAVDNEGKALIEATKAQSVITGVAWADAMNIAVRPILTYWWCIVLYTAYFIAAFVVALSHVDNIFQAILSIFGEPEKALVRMMVSFWFVDRAIRYMRKD